MRQVELIKVGNERIVYLDFSGIKKTDEIFKQIEVYGTYIKRQPRNSVLTLTNLENMYFNTEIFNAFVNYAKANNAFVRNSAVIGLEGMMNIFYKGFVRLTGRSVKICRSKNEAIHELTGSYAEIA